MSLAIVTGASRGIGRALTERLLVEGWAVVALSRSGRSAPGAAAYALDVADPVGVQQVFARVEADHGVPDLLVNNAALSGGSGRTLDTAAEDWWRIVEVNVSSGAATYPVGLENDGRLTSAYMASKAAVNGRPRERPAGSLVRQVLPGCERRLARPRPTRGRRRRCRRVRAAPGDLSLTVA